MIGFERKGSTEPGCLGEPCIALHDGLCGNKSEEEVGNLLKINVGRRKMGNRVHVEQARVLWVVFRTDRILRTKLLI